VISRHMLATDPGYEGDKAFGKPIADSQQIDIGHEKSRFVSQVLRRPPARVPSGAGGSPASSAPALPQRLPLSRDDSGVRSR
jgi:hypothetical protein